MPTFAVLALATPLFGFALTPPTGAVLPDVDAFPVVVSHLDDETTPDDDIDEVDDADDAVPTAEQTAEASGDTYAADMRQRAELMPVHRAFGIATWISMLATVTLGTIQYVNLYGFFGGVEDTPCVQGGAVFGDEQCYGVSWPHRISAITTTALYTASFTLSLLMPDPDHLDQGNSDYARNLSLHKTLRWMHTAGMVAQLVLGLFTANAQEWFGLDRANNFGELQAMATAHEVIGLTTFGLLTAAGAIMLF